MDERTLPPDLPDAFGTVWVLIRRIAGQLDREGEALFRRELGISLAQFLVLSVVDAYPGPLSQQAIADRLGLTKGTVSRQIDAAAAAGLMTVEVASHTRRENAVSLTSRGTDLVRRGDELSASARAGILEAIDPDDLPGLRRSLESLLGALTGVDGS